MVKILGEVLIPFAMGFNDQVADFPNRSTTTGTAGHIMGDLADFQYRIGHRCRQTYPGHNRQIEPIIAHIGNLRRGQAEIGDTLFVYFTLGAGAVVQQSDALIFSPPLPEPPNCER